MQGGEVPEAPPLLSRGQGGEHSRYWDPASADPITAPRCWPELHFDLSRHRGAEVLEDHIHDLEVGRLWLKIGDDVRKSLLPTHLAGIAKLARGEDEGEKGHYRDHPRGRR